MGDDANRMVQLVRAALLESDIDLDYTSAVNFLTTMGYIRLARVGWKKSVLNLLVDYIADPNLQLSGLEDARLDMLKKGPHIPKDDDE